MNHDEFEHIIIGTESGKPFRALIFSGDLNGYDSKCRL